MKTCHNGSKNDVLPQFHPFSLNPDQKFILDHHLLQVSATANALKNSGGPSSITGARDQDVCF